MISWCARLVDPRISLQTHQPSLLLLPPAHNYPGMDATLLHYNLYEYDDYYHHHYLTLYYIVPLSALWSLCALSASKLP